MNKRRRYQAKRQRARAVRRHRAFAALQRVRDAWPREMLSVIIPHESTTGLSALGTKAPYIGFMETIEPYLEWWKQSAVRNYFILPVKAAYDRAGNLLPIPQRTVQEPAIQAMTMAAQAAKDDIHTTTGIPPVALGQLDPHDRSGKAIQALQGQSEVGTSGYLDNFVNITLAYEGKVVRDLIPKVFDRPGRIVPAVGVDEKRRLVMLNYPYIEGPDGQPQKAVPQWQKGMPVPKEIAGPDGQPVPVKYIDLTAGEYSVAPTVGKSYATRREEASAAVANVMQVIPPEMAAAIAPAWLEEQDYPGARKIAEIAKKSLPPQLAAAYQDDKGKGAIPPEIQAQLQQLQQQNQQMQQALEGKQAEAQADAQAKMQLAQMQGQVDLQKAQMDNATKVQIAELNANASIAVADTRANSADLDRRLKAVELMLTADQQARLDAESQAHEAGSQGREHAHERLMAELGHAHAADQMEQQAAMSNDADGDGA